MKSKAADLPLSEGPDLAGLEPIQKIRRRWPTFLGALLTGLMVFGLARQLLVSGVDSLWHAVPQNPLFYLFFAGVYMSSPLGDYAIYRYVWKLPLEGLGALMRKRIANDVIIGYSGDLYFYAWARQRLNMLTSPFGTVKDVTILSGVAGNSLMIAMVAVVLPYAAELFTPDAFQMIARSAVILFVISALFIIFSRRVFSLPAKTLRVIFLIHCLRIVFDSSCLALAWHFAMPSVSVGMWIFLVAARLVVFRLPLVPNKDLLFANFAIIFIGQGEALGNLIAFGAALSLLLHVVVMSTFGLLALKRN